MKYLKKYTGFNSINENNQNRIEYFCRKNGIHQYTINSDGSVDVNGNVIISNKFDLTKDGRLPFTFNNVTGNFTVNSVGLESLEGSPRTVGRSFECVGNNLTSLVGAPDTVGWMFDCRKNKLTNLEGCPQQLENLYCNDNKLTTLEGAPKERVATLYCQNNFLTDLYGAPRVVEGDLIAENNQLETLEGTLEQVKRLTVTNNKLTSLKGCPLIDEINSHVNFSNNQISEVSYEDISKIKKDLSGITSIAFDKNPILNVIKIFGDWSIFISSVEWDYFEGPFTINRLRLEEACLDAGVEMPSQVMRYKFI